MKIIKRIGVFIALLPLVATINAHAGALDDTKIVDNAGSNGDAFFKDIFFGGSFGQSEADGFCMGSSNCSREDTSWKIFGGYTLNNIMDVEVGYHSIGDLNRTTVSGTEISELSALSLNVVGNYRINDTIEAFGKVGAAGWSSSNTVGDQDGVGITYGLGAKISMNENMRVRAEWEIIPAIDTGSGENDVSIFSLGIELKMM